MKSEDLLKPILEKPPWLVAYEARQAAQAERDAAQLRNRKGAPPTTTGGALAEIPGDVATRIGAGAASGVERLAAGARYMTGDFEGATRNLSGAEAIGRAASTGAQGQALPPMVSEAVGGAAESLTMMAPAMALGPAVGAVAGPVAGGKATFGAFATTFGAAAAAQAAKEAQEAGMSTNEARVYVAVNAAIEPAIMGLFQAAGAGGLESMIIRKGAPGLVAETSKGALKALRKYPVIANYLKSTGEEIPEELLTELTQSTAQYLSGVDPNALDPDRLASDVANVVATTMMTTGAVSAIQAPGTTGQYKRQVEDAKQERSRRSVLRATEREMQAQKKAAVGLPREATAEELERRETDIREAVDWGRASTIGTIEEEAAPTDEEEQADMIRGAVTRVLGVPQDATPAAIAERFEELRRDDDALSDMSATEILEVLYQRNSPEAIRRREREQEQEEERRIADENQRQLETEWESFQANRKAMEHASERDYRRQVAGVLGLPEGAPDDQVNEELGKVGLSLSSPRDQVLKALPDRIRARSKSMAEKEKLRRRMERQEAARAAEPGYQPPYKLPTEEERRNKLEQARTVNGRKSLMQDANALSDWVKDNRQEALAILQEGGNAYKTRLRTFAEANGFDEIPDLSDAERDGMERALRSAVLRTPAEDAGWFTPDVIEDIVEFDRTDTGGQAVKDFIETPSRQNYARIAPPNAPKLGREERARLADSLRDQSKKVTRGRAARTIGRLRLRAAAIRDAYRGLIEKDATVTDDTGGEGASQGRRRGADIAGTKESLERQHRAVMRLVSRLRDDVGDVPRMTPEQAYQWKRLERAIEDINLTEDSFTMALSRLGMALTPNAPPHQWASIGRMFAAVQWGEVRAAEFDSMLSSLGVKMVAPDRPLAKPLDEMTNDELVKKAKELGVSTPKGIARGPLLSRIREAQRAQGVEEEMAPAPPQVPSGPTMAELVEKAKALGIRSPKSLSRETLLMRIREAQEAKGEQAVKAIEGMIAGRPTIIHVKTEGKDTWDARYALVPIDEVVPSHNPRTFDKSRAYRFKNTRDYSNTPTYQENVRKHAAAINPLLLLDATMSPNLGPPIILEDGNVLGGNSRAMTLQLAAGIYPKQAQKYTDRLREMAANYGIDPADVKPGMMLVRVLPATTPEAEIPRMINVFNNSEINVQPTQEKGLSIASLIGPDFIDGIEFREDEKFSDTLSREGVGIVNAAISAGIIPETEKTGLVTQRTSRGAARLTDQGRALLEASLLGLMIKSTAVNQNLTDVQRELFIRIIPNVLAIRQKVNASTLPPQADMTDDLELVAEAMIERGTSADVPNQGSFLNEGSERVEALFRLFMEGVGRPAAFSKMFQAMATEIGNTASSFDPDQSMFGGEFGEPPEPMSEAEVTALIRRYTQQLSELPRRGAKTEPAVKAEPAASQTPAEPSVPAAPATPAPQEGTEAGVEFIKGLLSTPPKKTAPKKTAPKSEANPSETPKSSPPQPPAAPKGGDFGKLINILEGRSGPAPTAGEMAAGGVDLERYNLIQPLLQGIWQSAGSPKDIDAFSKALYDGFLATVGGDKARAIAALQNVAPELRRFAVEVGIIEDDDQPPPPDGEQPPPPTPPEPSPDEVMRRVIAQFTDGGRNLEGLMGDTQRENRRTVMQALLGREVTNLTDASYSKVLAAIHDKVGIPEKRRNDIAFRNEVRDAIEYWVKTGKQYDPNAPKKMDRIPEGKERIVTARAERMPAPNFAVIPERFMPHLDEHQKVGAALAISALTSSPPAMKGSFMLADGTGTGKTRMILASAAAMRENGTDVVIIVVPNEVIGKPFDPDVKKKNKGVEKISGSYADDSKTMGITLTLLDGNRWPSAPGIYVTTYHRIESLSLARGKSSAARGQSLAMALDESHQIKNRTAVKSMAAGEIIDAAEAVLFASATPVDKVEHITYLAPLLDHTPKGFAGTMREIGFELNPPTGKGKAGHIERWTLKKGVSLMEAGRRMQLVFHGLTDMGLMVKREISMKGYNVKLIDIEPPSEWNEAMDIIARAETGGKSFAEASGFALRQIRMHWRRQGEFFKYQKVMPLIKSELAAGRQVLVFVHRTNHSEVRERLFEDDGSPMMGPNGKQMKGSVVYESEGTARLIAADLAAEGIPYGEIHGERDPKVSLEETIAGFQSGASKVIVATYQSGGTGISLDDRVGDTPRTVIVLTSPFTAVEIVQLFGRVWRLPTKSIPRGYMMFFKDDPMDDWLKTIAGNKMMILGAAVDGEVRKMDPNVIEGITEGAIIEALGDAKPGEERTGELPDLEEDYDYVDFGGPIEAIADYHVVPPAALATDQSTPIEVAKARVQGPFTGADTDPIPVVEPTEAALEPGFVPKLKPPKVNAMVPSTYYDDTPIEAAKAFDVVAFATALQKGKAPAVINYMSRTEGHFSPRPWRSRMKPGSDGQKAEPKIKGIELSAGIFIGPRVAFTAWSPKGKDLSVGEQMELERKRLVKVVSDSSGIPEAELRVRFIRRRTVTPTKREAKNNIRPGRYFVEIRKVDPMFARRVIAHEAWHLVDYLDEGMIQGRGNIFGHIAALKRYMMHTLSKRPANEPVTPAERKTLWEEATVEARGLKAADPRVSIAGVRKTIYDRKIAKVMALRGLVEKKDFTRQAVAISVAMRGPIGRRPGDVAYRMNPAELYADIGSALMLRPEWMKRTYPDVYEALTEWLVARPSAKAAYDAMRDIIEKGDSTNALRAAMVEGFQEHERQLQAERVRDEATAKRMTGVEWLLTALFDKFHPLTTRVRDYYRKNPMRAGESSEYAIETATYSGAMAEEYLKSVKADVLDLIEANEIPEDDLNIYLFAQRVLKERKEIGNPFGVDREAANGLLDEIKGRLGDSRYAIIEQAAANFNTIRQGSVIRMMREGGHYGAALLEYVEKNSAYVRFDVNRQKWEIDNLQDIVDDKFGAGTGLKVFRQVGTMRAIGRPLSATAYHDVALIRSMAWNNAKRAVVRDLITMRDSGDSNAFIVKADDTYNVATGRRDWVERKDANHATLYYMENGRLMAVYVRPEVEKAFDRSDTYQGAHAWWMRSWLRTLVLGLPRQLFTGKNPGFWLFNVPRDFLGTIARVRGLNPVNFFRFYIKAIRPSFRAAFGMKEEAVDRMLREGSLISMVQNKGRDAETVQLEEQLADYGLDDGRSDGKKPAVVQATLRVGRWLDRVSRAIEMVPKVGADMYLREAFPDMPGEVRAHIIRVRAGSPPFLRKGTATWATNDLLLYSNAIIQGWSADIEAMREAPAEYLWKRAAYSIAPAAMTGLLASNFFVALAKALGADDDDEIVQTFKAVQRLYKNISEYNRANFMILPPPFMGLDETGRTMFFRLPQDEFGRLFGGMTHILIKDALDDPNFDRGIKELARMGVAQSPNLNPMLGAAWDAIQWFAMGVNPYDSFRESQVLSETDAAARTKESHLAVLKHLSNKMGLGMIYRFQTNTDAQPKTWFDKVSGTPFVGGNVLNRFVQVSSAGTAQELYEIRQPFMREQARITQVINRAAVKVERGQELTEEEKALMDTERGQRRITRMESRASGDPYRKVLATEMPREQRNAISQRIVEREAPGFDVSPLVKQDVLFYGRAVARPRPMKLADIPAWKAEREAAIKWFKERNINSAKAYQIIREAEEVDSASDLRRLVQSRMRLQAIDAD